MRMAIETETTATPSPTPATSMPGSTSRDVAPVLADVGEKGHPRRCDQERSGERAADAVLADDVTGGVGAGSCRESRAG